MKPKWKLISKDTGKEAKLGMEMISFRDQTYTYAGGQPPHRVSGTGLIYAKRGENFHTFYPGVFNHKWEKK